MEEPNPSSPSCLDIQDNTVQTGYSPSDMQVCTDGCTDGDVANMKDESDSSEFDHLKHSCQKLMYPKEFELDSGLKWSDRRQFAVSENEGMVGKYEGRHQGDGSEISRSNNRLNKQLRNNSAKSNVRVGGPKFAEKFYCPVNRLNGRYDSHACNCNTHTEYRVKADPCIPRWTRETKAVNKSESASDISKPYYRVSKCTRPEYVRENFARPKNKITIWSNASNRDSPVTKKVWEPTDSQKYPRSNSDSNLTLRSTLQTGASDTYKHLESSATNSSDEVSEISVQMIAEEKVAQELIKSSSETDNKCHSSFDLEAKSPLCMKEVADEGNDLCRRNLSSIRGTSNLSTSSSSNSDNCSSCLSEGDSNTSSSNLLNPESSSTSDSEESSQNSEGRDTNLCLHNGFNECQDEVRPQKIECVGRVQDVKILAPVSVGTESLVNLPPMLAPSSNSARLNVTLGIQPQAVLPPPVHNQNVQFPMFQHPTMGYYYQSPVSLAAAPANGLMSFPHSGQYLFGNPYGYGLNGSTPFMHYGALQHTSQPLYNSGCLPVFQSTAQTKGINSSEHAKGTKENHHEDSVERTTRTGLQATEAAPTSGTTGQSSKFDVGNPGFSLFAFSDPASVKEGIAGNFSQNLSMHRTKGDDHDCNKKLAPPVEEYNPFANGIKFSFADIVI
nr:uncharacterized protein LOC109181475 [Ipomoea batatas]